MTHLRQLMLDELQRRNYSQSTTRCYLHAVEDFARYFHRSPERLGPEHIRQYQAYLFRERKLSPGTIEGRTAALRFLFIKTLRRPYLPDHIPFPKRQRRLPTILDQQEVARLIDSASNLMHRTMMMMLYATGLRRAEMCHLKVTDIDSKPAPIHLNHPACAVQPAPATCWSSNGSPAANCISVRAWAPQSQGGAAMTARERINDHPAPLHPSRRRALARIAKVRSNSDTSHQNTFPKMQNKPTSDSAARVRA